MISADGNICLIDFNISLNDPDHQMTTGYSRNYAAPEQLGGISSGKVLGAVADVRTDIFSLGASFYQLMSRKNALKQIESGLSLWDESTPYSGLLTDIIDKALEKDPSKRFQSASDMYKSLDTMKLRDRRYKRLGRLQTVYTLICLIIFAAGVYMTVKGGLIMREEAFGREYDMLIDNAETMSEDEIIEGAFSLLNNTSYTRILENNSQEKGTILYLAASSYFDLEDYENAIKLYEEAIETDGSDPDNYRDLAIAYARSGDTDKARKVLEEAINKGLDDAGLYLVRGEIAGADQNYNDAIDDYLKVLKLSSDEDIIARAGILCARAYAELDDYDNADLILTDVFKRVTGKWTIRVMRENAQICLKYLEKSSVEDSAKWLSKADECYTYLMDHSQAIVSDYINLSYIKNMNGETDKALEIMTLAADLYPEDYRIPMRQAEYYMILQGSLLEDERDYSKVLEYYEKAKTIYDKVKVSGDSDDEMQRLENDIEELYALGWLE
jgi:serine/threonine-protein kinase